jgi:hypothetical protein
MRDHTDTIRYAILYIMTSPGKETAPIPPDPYSLYERIATGEGAAAIAGGWGYYHSQYMGVSDHAASIYNLDTKERITFATTTIVLEEDTRPQPSIGVDYEKPAEADHAEASVLMREKSSFTVTEAGAIYVNLPPGLDPEAARAVMEPAKEAYEKVTNILQGLYAHA